MTEVTNRSLDLQRPAVVLEGMIVERQGLSASEPEAEARSGCQRSALHCSLDRTSSPSTRGGDFGCVPRQPDCMTAIGSDPESERARCRSPGVKDRGSSGYAVETVCSCLCPSVRPRMLLRLQDLMERQRWRHDNWYTGRRLQRNVLFRDANVTRNGLIGSRTPLHRRR